MYAAHIKDIDNIVLDGSGADMAEEPARERLFDVLMRRIELLAPHKAAVRSLMSSLLPVIASTTPLDEATGALRRISAHLGAVVDDSGRTVGVVALADLVEEFVGTVRDETHRV